MAAVKEMELGVMKHELSSVRTKQELWSIVKLVSWKRAQIAHYYDVCASFDGHIVNA
jgi:23S rRNA maturation-related 3'-5' exoribonuclease YhaM